MKRSKRMLAAALTCCITAMPMMYPVSQTAYAEVSQENSVEYAEAIVSAVNDIRVSYGLSELAITPELLDVAELRASELTVLFDHYRPNGSTCFTAIREAGITYSASAENIAGGRADPLATVEQWMNSEGHRRNILGENYTHIGIGYAYDPDTSLRYHWCMTLVSVTDGSQPYVYSNQYIPERDKGDVDGSKSVNATDAAKILQYSASVAVGADSPVTSSFKKAADVNGDGEINSIDASIILAYSAAAGAKPNVTLDSFIW